MNKHAIRSGIIIGVVSILLSLIIYLIDPTLFASLWVLFIFFIVSIGLIIYFGIQHRNEEGGYLTFGKSWMYSFQAFIVAGIVSSIFRILLFNVIDPELVEIVTDTSIENTESMMRSFGAPAEQIDETIERTRTETPKGLTPVGILKGFLWGIIFYAIFALITGVIIKKKEPEFEG